MRVAVSKIAVVVPSPTKSFVLVAASIKIEAPKFSYLSSKVIDLAIVTPSLTINGEPKSCSITTFLPLGPNVTFTAFANVFAPIVIFSLAEDENNNLLLMIFLHNCNNIFNTCYIILIHS